MEEPVFLSEQNPTSGRHAVFEDDGVSGWLYLSEPGNQKVASACWIYNRIPAPDPKEIGQYRDGPPPAPTTYAGKHALEAAPEEKEFYIKWSPDGHSVALLIDSVPMGFTMPGERHGWSRNLVKAGPWGEPYDSFLYAKLFRNEKILAL